MNILLRKWKFRYIENDSYLSIIRKYKIYIGKIVYFGLNYYKICIVVSIYDSYIKIWKGFFFFNILFMDIKCYIVEKVIISKYFNDLNN